MKSCLRKIVTSCILLSTCILLSPASFAQWNYPVSLEARIAASKHLVIGKVALQHSYMDNKGNIYTLNKIDVTAWAKNMRLQNDLYVITLGGVVGGKAQVTTPAVQLKAGEEYFLALEEDNTINDDKIFRSNNPTKVQALVYADEQGAMPLQNGAYLDPTTGNSITEQELLQQVFSITSQQAKTPDGSPFIARYNPRARNTRAIDAITSFTPNPPNAGTIVPTEYLTITGTGFGTAPGNVEFRNADNGGATFISVTDMQTDYLTWNDTVIVVKVPSKAGTGTIRVNGVESLAPLQIGYSHISIYSTFNGFADTTRQRYYLRNKDGLGGYTFLYNTTSGFSDSTAAVAAFERALTTWRCNTGINWRSNGTTTAVYAADGINSVLFDVLPAGAAGRATSRFSASATAACTGFNTVWWLDEIDVQFLRNPATGYTWQFGPTAPTSLQYDFESIALHELGHAHGLDHRIAPGQVMNYNIGNGVAARTPSAAEVSGGIAKVNYSTAATCFDPAGSGAKMLAWSSGGCSSLPIQLLSFEGVPKEYGNELTWVSNDAGSDGIFEVEKSINGTTFKPIGSVKSKTGNTTETYRFTDRYANAGVTYYRLKMIDKDGTYEYSKTITIKRNASVTPLTVSPNPAVSMLKIESSENTQLKMINASGGVVKRIQVRAGNNEINVSDISSGIYYLVNETGSQKVKVIVLH